MRLFTQSILLMMISLVSYSQNLKPIISSFSSNSGLGGSNITISGANFDVTPSNNVVYFGTCRANVVSASTTELTVTVPLGASSDKISVLNVSTNLFGISTAYFKRTLIGNNITSHSINNFVDYNANTNYHSIYQGDIDKSIVVDINGDGKNDIVTIRQENFGIQIT